ncbi:MAG: hypothetical protein KDD56_03705, partial [Bdellovibrionales bacterium]|nr:hypothetical protein [Bdellovibrionales bacterium]
MSDHGTELGFVKDNLAIDTNSNQEITTDSRDKEQIRIEQSNSSGTRIQPATEAAQLANAQQRTRQIEIELLKDLKGNESFSVSADDLNSSLVQASTSNSTDNLRLELAANLAPNNTQVETTFSVANSLNLELNQGTDQPETSIPLLVKDVAEDLHRFRDLEKRLEDANFISEVFLKAELAAYASGVPAADKINLAKEAALENILIKASQERGRALTQAEIEAATKAFNQEYQLERETIRNLELKFLRGISNSNDFNIVASKYADLASTEQEIRRIKISDQIRELGRQAQNERGNEKQNYGKLLDDIYRANKDLITLKFAREEFTKGVQLQIEKAYQQKIDQLRKEAVELAKRDYKDNPSKETVKSILEKYGAFNSNNEVDATLYKEFNQAYYSTREKLWDDLNILEKAWHGTGNFLDRAGDWFVTAAIDVKNFVVDATEFTKKVFVGIGELAKDAWNHVIKPGAKWLWNKAGEGLEWISKHGKDAFLYVIDPRNWPEIAGKIKDGIVWGVEKILDAVVWTANKLYEGVGWLVSHGFDALVYLVNPKNWPEILNKIGEFGKKVFNAITWAVDKLWKATSWLATNAVSLAIFLLDPRNWSKIPEKLANFARSVIEVSSSVLNSIGKVLSVGLKAIKSTLNFLYEVAKDLGVVDFINGVWEWGKNTISSAWQFIKAFTTTSGLAILAFLGKIEWQEVWDNFKSGISKALDLAKQGWAAFKKGFFAACNLFLEFSGLKDLGLFFHHLAKGLILYGQGRKLEAAMAFAQSAMHFMFAGPKLVLNTLTFGTAATAISIGQRIILKTFAKKVLQKNALAGAKLLLKEGGQEFGERIFERVGKEAAES